MKVVYLSNHGFGHMIRTIPMLETFSKSEKVYVCCGNRQIEFLKKYFEESMDKFIFKALQTDVGFVNYKNKLKVHKEKTQKSVFQFMLDLPKLINEEKEFLKDQSFNEVYADISPLGILVAKTMKKKVVVPTNFTWYKQYQHIGLDERIIDFYYKLDQMIDELWLYPLAFPFHYLHGLKRPVQFMIRPINEDKVKQLRDKYPTIVSIFSGMSSRYKVEVNNYNGLIITSDKIQIKYDGPIVILGPDAIDSHNYIAASDLVITKAGFTTLAECIETKTKMVLIERPSAYEDTYLIEEVKQLGLGTSIHPQELMKLDLGKILEENN